MSKLVTLQSRSESKVNLHNVVATTQEIQRLLTSDIFTQEQILVISGYKRQNHEYRMLFRRLEWYYTDVITVDAVQGRKRECTFYDLVLANKREMVSIGFIKDVKRTKVAAM